MEKGKGVLWFLYVCVLGLGFSRTTASLTRMMGLSVSAYFLLTAALIIAVLLLFYLPGKLLAGKFKSGTKKNAKPCRPAEQSRQPYTISHRMGPGIWLLGALLLGALVCVRLFLVPGIPNAAGQPDFERAVAGQVSSGFFLNDLYIQVLSALIPFFADNSPFFIGNLIFQVLGSLFLYAGIYMLAGRICACTALLCVICLPVFHNSTYMAEPQSLLFLFYGIVLWSCAICFAFVDKKNGGKRLPAWPGLIAGGICGAAGSVHLLLCSLLFIFPASMLNHRKKAGSGRNFIVFFLAAACSFFLILYLNGLAGGQGLSAAGMRWLTEGISREYDAILHSPSLTDWWMTIPVYLFAFLSVFGVLEQEQTTGSVWIFPFLTVMTAEIIGKAPLQEQGIRFVLLGIMAGHGILQTVSVPGARKQMADGSMLEDWPAEGRKQVQPELADIFERDLEGGEDEMAEQNERMDEMSKQEAAKGQKALEPAPGTWLDNPLPVPKRHVKREMGYGFEPDPDQMFFDIPVSDLDDFDIE